ncbi:MAG: hypothetical protein Q8921_08955, partial [Bacteroidota bacterium]|nr:hypothetical protein [Bacteroidota bacterium]
MLNRILPFMAVSLLLLGAISSCTHQATNPPNPPKCDTCCDTCHHDSTSHSNDTTSHNFTWTEFTNVNGESNMTGCWVFGPND